MWTAAQVLEKEVFPLLSGFYDTPFIVWLLKTRPEYAAKVFFEDQLGINRHWLQMKWGAEEVATLVTHYAGAESPCAGQCQTCLSLCPAPGPRQQPRGCCPVPGTGKCTCVRGRSQAQYGISASLPCTLHTCEAMLCVNAQCAPRSMFGLARLRHLATSAYGKAIAGLQAAHSVLRQSTS